jgi:hypothetical protein
MNDKKVKLEKIIEREQKVDLIQYPNTTDNNASQLSSDETLTENSNQINQDSEYRDGNESDISNPGFSDIVSEWYYPIYIPYKNNH